jgi:hypothetical protein
VRKEHTILKRPSYVLRLLATVGIISMMFAGLAGTASAGQNPSGGTPAYWDGDTLIGFFGPIESDDVNFDPWLDGAQEVYFASVCNMVDMGLGSGMTSITVQNIDVDDAYIFIYVGGSVKDFTEYAYLSAGASKTFQAGEAGVPAGECAPVIVTGYNYLDDTLAVPVYMAGVAKQAVGGENLPYTTAADTSVSGYNAVSGREVGFFDQLYFPIVQTNCGPGGCWDTQLTLSNVGIDANAAVTVRFFPADDGSGSLQTGFQLQALLDAGDSWEIDLSEWVPEGWVGSAHVFTDDAVVGIADRFKVGTDMWITNTASNAASESFFQFPTGPANAPYVLFAPDVRTDWNGWNTGINVANTFDGDNQVTIQYFGSNGNAPQAQTRRLAAHGMTYFYNPSSPSEDECEQPATDVPGCEYIGGAIIFSEAPVTAVIDGVKYFGNDANVGQAFSYSATGNAYTDLAMPLVQKGNPIDGMGATSGINFLNPNAEATIVDTTWINPSGFGASNFGSSIVWVPGYATGFVYTMFHENLPNGFYGSALVDSDLPVVATSANVDYQVDGDGTVVWNLYNPCGFFRQSGFPQDGCVYSSPLEPLPVSATLTKTVTCTTCDLDFDGVIDADIAVEGAMVTYSGADANGFPVSGSGMTNEDGEIVFAVPAGTYDITVTPPAGYAAGDVSDTGIVVPAGGAVAVTNDLVQAPLEGEGRLTKELDLSGFAGTLGFATANVQGEILFCEGFVDVADCDSKAESVVYGSVDDFINIIGPSWQLSAEVPAGAYTICSAVSVSFTGDFDEDATTPDTTETVSYGTAELLCETAYVFDGQETVVVNDVAALATGSLEVYVENAGVALANIEITVYDVDGVEVASAVTDATGLVSFALPAGTYTVSAVDANGAAGGNFEDQDATIDYTIAGDLAAGFGALLDGADTADVQMTLTAIP